MPDVSSIAPDATDPEVPVSDAPAVSPAAPPSPPATAIAPPPSWPSVEASDQYKNATPQIGAQVFKRWTSQGQAYLDSLKGANPQEDQKAQQQFNAQVADIGAKNFQVGFPQDQNGKLLTIGKAASVQGVSPESLYQNQFDTPDLPYTVPKTISAAESEQGFVGAVGKLITVPLTPVSKAYDWITSTHPGSTMLDKYLENVDQMRRNTEAANPGGVAGTLAYGLPEAVGNIEAMAVAGRLGGKFFGSTEADAAPLASGFNRGMALFAGADASEETYHNAINDGATTTQAAESAAVAGGINFAVMMSLGLVNKAALGRAMGDNAAAFEKGLYKPTVGEMTKYMAYDAAGNAASASAGQVGQNAFDRSTYDPDRSLVAGVSDAAIQQSLFSLAHLPGLAKAFMGNAGPIKDAAKSLVDAKTELDQSGPKALPGPEGIPLSNEVPATDIPDASHEVNKALAQQMAARLSDEDLTKITTSLSPEVVGKAVESVQETARNAAADPSLTLAQKQQAVDSANAYVDMVNKHEGSTQYFPLDASKIITGVHSAVDGDLNTYYAGHKPEVGDVADAIDTYNNLTHSDATSETEPARTIPLVLASKYELAKRNFAIILKDTAKSAEQPTIGHIDEAKAIVSGDKPIPGTNPLADANESLKKELSEPAEGEDENNPVPNETNPDEAQAEKPTETEPIQSPADPGSTEGQAMESGTSSKPESGAAAESAPVVAGESESKGTAPATHLGDQEQAGGKPPIPLYNLHEDIPGHSKGSTVSGDTLTKAGYDLPDTKPQSDLRSRIMTALGKAAPKTAKIVFSKEHDHTAWADPAQPGKIFVNPDAMSEALGHLDEGFKDTEHGDEYIRRLMTQKTGEEVIHNAQHQIRDQTDHAAIHDAIPEPERKATIARYGDSIDASKGTSPEDIADRKTRFVEEHARQILQRKALGETTEDVWKQGDKSGLVRYFQSLYQKIKAHIATFGDTSELGKYLKNIEGVLADAEKAGQKVSKGDVSGGANPPSKDEASKDEEDATKEEPKDRLQANENGIEFKGDASKLAGSQVAFAPKPKASYLEDAKKLSGELKNQAVGLKKFGPLERIVNKFGAREQTKSHIVDETVKQIQKEVPNQLHDEGMALYIDAKGDVNQLAKWQKLVEQAPKTPENILYAKRLEAAQHLPAKALEWVNHINQNKDLIRQSLTRWGVNVGYVDNYITRMWKLDSTGEPIRNLSGRSFKTTFRFAGNRSIANSFEGWRQGLEPAEQRASVLWGHYMNEAMGVVNARRFVADANKNVMPDGKPMVSPDQQAKWVDVENPIGKARLIQKPFSWGQHADYRSLDLPAFTDWYTAGQIDGKKLYLKGDMFVHPDVYEKFHNMFSNSKISEWYHEPTTDPFEKVIKLGTKFVVDDARKWIKGTLLGGFPAFHIQQEAMGALGYGVNPIREALKSPIDTNDPRYQFASEHGVSFFATQASLHTYMEGFSANNSLLLKALENVPGVREAGGKYLAQIAKDSTDWTFKHFIPRLKLATFENILARKKATFSKELKAGTVTEDDLAYRASYDTNNAYGHLNYLDLGRSATRQHLMNIVALAPDFWEARLRHTVSALAGATGSKANREQFRSFAILGGGLYVAARVLNQIMDGDPHYEPENAFRIVDGNRSYQMRSYITDFQEMLSNTRTYFNGRINPVARFVEEGASGVNYRGEKIDSADIFRDLLAETVPIPLQSVTRGLSTTGTNSPVSPLEQFMGAMGIKVSRFAPAQQIFPLAKAWEAQQGIPADRGVYPTSQFTPLKYALEDGDYDQASKLYQALLDAHKGNAMKVMTGLRDSINHPFTQSRADDMKFYQSLSDKDKLVYKAAVDSRHLLLQRFAQMRQQK